MTFERSFDYELIKSIITHPKVYPHVSDDSSPTQECYEPIQSEAIWYVVVKDGEELLGMWTLVPQNGVCWEIHTCLLPNAWGSRGKAAAKRMAAWIWENTQCLRLVTNVPQSNRLALMFAMKAGMERYGLNPKSYQKDGNLQDQVLLGMSRPGV